MRYCNPQFIRMMHLLLFALFLTGMAIPLYAQQVVMKTNGLGWLATTPNLGVEIALAPQFTLDVSGSYNAWNYGNNARLRHCLLQPELRYWFCGNFQKHFVGAHLHAADYNIGNISLFPGLKNYSYRGQLYGAGVSYGYHFPLSPRWALEATIGVGYAYMKYKKYTCHQCAELKARVTRHYIGPTKAAVNLIYVIH